MDTSQAVTPFWLDLIVLGKHLIPWLMCAAFVGLIILRLLIYYTVSREETFAREFELRVNDFLRADNHTEQRSFFVLVKKLIEKTFYEMFESRAAAKRGKLDYITEPGDRVFLVHQGMAYLVRDTLKEIQFIKFDGSRPPLMEIVKNVFANNPCFTRVFGYLSVSSFNDFLNILPGLFIVGGIFGTFLGIMQALPELGALNIKDPESTKAVMDAFLSAIASSMTSSTIGIFLSVLGTVYNNFVSPERLFIRIVDRFERNLFRLWSRCDNNLLPNEIPQFDEHRDAIEALASLSVDRALAGATRGKLETPASRGHAHTPPPPPPGAHGPQKSPDKAGDKAA